MTISVYKFLKYSTLTVSQEQTGKITMSSVYISKNKESSFDSVWAFPLLKKLNFAIIDIEEKKGERRLFPLVKH